MRDAITVYMVQDGLALVQSLVVPNCAFRRGRSRHAVTGRRFAVTCDSQEVGIMKDRYGTSRLIILPALLVLVVLDATAAELPAPASASQQIEDDWLRQVAARKAPPARSSRSAAAVATRQDAVGGCDGIKDGKFGFHTNRDENPWWQVDLGQSLLLDRVVIYNRCDGNVEDRAGRLQVLLSDNGRNWTELYRHDGTKFYGQTDNKPLAVPALRAKARLVRVQLPAAEYLHLDEVEVYQVGKPDNVALGRPADQSSASQWSRVHSAVAPGDAPTVQGDDVLQGVLDRGFKLADDLRRRGADVAAEAELLRELAGAVQELSPDTPTETRQRRYLQARWAVRRMALKNPLLDFDDLLLVKRVPGTFTHMSDQYYGWFSRPGGGLYVLEDFKTDAPTLRCLSGQLPAGSILRPDLSYDGKRVLFAHCRHYPGLKDERNKLDKSNLPEDAFYHLYEMNLDGSGLKRLTRGKYDDFDGRYLPDGRIVFLSTRRGQHVQCGRQSGAASADGAGPDSYVRCGGGLERPVAIYTLHVMDADGGNLTQISPFENFEWTPSIDHDGRILYARWDYVDRHNMPFMSLWSTMPDGTGARAVFGNYTRNPHCIFEARPIPGSRKLIFTASGHHAFTGGCLVLLDPNRGADGEGPMTRLTPEVVFPESEGWPSTYFVNPYPLAEEHYLVAWSAAPLPPGTPRPHWGMPGPPNDLGVYLFDAFGNLNLLYRDPEISSMYPLPIRPRRRPPQIPSQIDWNGDREGQMLVIDVYDGLQGVPRGTVDRLRIVGVPAKTHPTMNHPVMGLTRDDPGKFVIGTVPVEADGSANFRAPAGVSFFVQALDRDGMAVQTMRSVTYVQPGQRYTCIGCHEPRHTAPPGVLPLAAAREPSKIAPGPQGSWPLDFQQLVQPVMQRHCVRCHQPGGEDPKFDLTAANAYESLVGYGRPSLREHVQTRYNEGRSIAGACAARGNHLWKLLDAGHYEVKLGDDDRQRLITWMDTYGQRLGSFDQGQEERLRQLRRRMAAMLED
jgi:hypothetical protein